MIEGAVCDAANGHPQWDFDKRFVQSISKRAAGTLSAQWPHIFAISRAKVVNIIERAKPTLRAREKRRNMAVLRNQRQPNYIKTLTVEIGNLAGEARRAGNTEREKACIEILRMIHRGTNEEISQPQKNDASIEDGTSFG